ncbi:MAG: SUMF1/EgtB/PvdO family nonheme iron enzyme, partial [Planctomycetota bacterium]
PGPRFWANSQPPADRMDHPVVGICWYEASAYASWAGKRLPSSEQWQRAGTWPSGSSESAEQRYTWGNAFDPTKANLWQNDFSDTLPVDDMPEGATPNGVRQLVGNVWEWVDAQYCPASECEVRIVLDELLAEVRGGAFDTYFASQATCQFRSGNPVYHRAANVGFRCCVSADQINFQPEAVTSEESL